MADELVIEAGGTGEDHIKVTQEIMLELLTILGEAWVEIDELKGRVADAGVAASAVPAVAARPVVPAGAESSLPADSGEYAHGVLIVDDSKVLLMRLKSSVESLGYKVLGVADNGLTGAELAVQLRPRLIIIDHQMPTMSGLDCVKAIRRQNLQSRVIVCSAHISSELISSYSGLNVADMLGKPIALDTLIRSLRREMDGADKAQQA